MENTNDILASWREYQALPSSEWRKDFFCPETGGYLVTSWRRIEEAEKSNQETKKYEREHHICLVYAKNGHGMVSDEEFYGASYGLNLDNDFGLRNGGTGGSLIMPALPGHGESGNQNAPLGGGALLLIGFGAAYALKKRKSRK